MKATAEVNTFPQIGEHASQLRVKNPREKSTLPLCVEPWGTQLNLLPDQSYMVVSEFQPTDEVEALMIEASDCLTVWPQGTKSNRIYRDDGKVIWDDARPSEIYCLLTEKVIEASLKLVKMYAVDLDTLGGLLEVEIPASESFRHDLAYLLVEHGVLHLAEDGTLSLAAQQRDLQSPVRTKKRGS